MQRLAATLETQFAEGARLERIIREQWQAVQHG